MWPSDKPKRAGGCLLPDENPRDGLGRKLRLVTGHSFSPHTCSDSTWPNTFAADSAIKRPSNFCCSTAAAAVPPVRAATNKRIERGSQSKTFGQRNLQIKTVNTDVRVVLLELYRGVQLIVTDCLTDWKLSYSYAGAEAAADHMPNFFKSIV